MATFEAKKLDLTQVNGGQEYEQGDFLQSDTINDVVEGTAYAQNVAEEANTKSNNAVSTANSANSTANAASAKVDTFEQRITTAQNTADTAVSNAATAQSTADSATTEINKVKNGTTVVPNANHAINADNANMATNAQQDVNGNPINTTYATVEYVDDLVTEKQGTRVTVNNVNVAELSFTSDPQTQITANKNAIAEAQSDISDIVSGAQTVGKATQDADGNVIDTTYAKLTQVVRVDEAQSLTDTQKQQAQKNVTVVASTQQIYGQPITAGWYEIAKIAQATCGKIIWAQGSGSGYPAEWKIDVSIGIPWNSSDINAILSFEGMGVSPSYNIPKRARLRRIGSDYYFDVYVEQTDAQNAIYCVFDMYSGSQNPVEITPLTSGMFPNRGTVDEPSGSVTLIIDIRKNGINTTGQIYQQGAPVFATDPTKLEPSTANGWTQTTATGSLPSAGVFMVSFDEETNATIGTGVLFFDGQNVAQTVTAASTVAVVTILYHHTGSTKWRVAVNANQLNLTSVYYKRIA